VSPLRVKVGATGLYLPPTYETADDLAPRLQRSRDWILARTGVAKRHVSHEPMDQMGARAVRAALGDGPPPDLLVNASGVAHQLIPDSSVHIQRALGWEKIPSFSIHATCLSFLVALQNVSCLIASGAYKRVCIVSSELATPGRDFSSPESAALIGDGAAAAVLQPTPDGQESALLAWRMRTWPEFADLSEVRGFGMRRHPDDPETTFRDQLFHMNGPALYRKAIERGACLIQELMRDAEMCACEADLVVPHQTTDLGVRVYARFGFREDRIVNVVREQGNCVAASIPLALATAHAQGRLKRGMRVVIVGTGAGLSIAGAVLRW
jgi:3-oxoacyl-[acyl-carrier-protein] synthase-3